MQLWEHRAASALFERWYQHDAHVKDYLWHLHMLAIGMPDYLADIAKRRSTNATSK